jgi:hypothetical protein
MRLRTLLSTASVSSKTPSATSYLTQLVASDINRHYALVEQTARGSLNAITSTLQDIIRRSQARQGDPQVLAEEIESAFVTTLPTYRAAEAILQGGQVSISD